MKKNIKILFLIITLFGCMAMNFREAVSSDQGSEEEKIKETIYTYFSLRYNAAKSLEPSNFMLVTVPNEIVTTETIDWLNIEQSRQDIEFAIAKTFDAVYLDYKFSLDYISIEIRDSKAIVKLLEGNEVNYVNAPNFPSKMANLEHTIILRKVDTEWKIANDQYQNEIIDLLRGLPKEEILKNIQTNHDSQFSPPIIVEQLSLPNSTYFYNGTAAANYADTWYSSINPTYHDAGLDCTNYASQGIYEGTNQIMSNPDNYSTKWYYDFPSHTGSYPWVNVEGLYAFITTNTGRGPYGYSSGSYTCNLSKGHVVTMKKNDAWKHTVIVADFSGDCHDPSKILVDSHDPDYWHKPLSNWSGYSWYAITISGYRD